MIAALFAACIEQPHREYLTRADAIVAGELERGWLPVWVPAGATEIRLQGDLDTNRVWLRFQLPPAELAKLRSHLRELPEDEVGSLPWSRPLHSKAWWPSSLAQQQSANEHSLVAEVFEGPDERFVLALQPESGNVFAWSVP